MQKTESVEAEHKSDDILCLKSDVLVQALAVGEVSELDWFEGKTFWHSRAKAELDDSLVQVIPYLTIEQPQTLSISASGYLTYRRSKKSGEKALMGKLSIGFGGHVSREDEGASVEATLFNAAARELYEELGVEWESHCLPEVRGLIWAPVSRVSRIHVGVQLWVDHWSLTGDALLHPGPEIAQLGWRTPEQLRSEPDLEDWTKEVLKNIE